MVSNANSKLNNPQVRDKKCATCRHYEQSPLRRRGWCRNPLLYDRHTNHLVEEDTLACSRGFGSVDYWEPLVLRDGRAALTRREKQQARAASLEADKQIGEEMAGEDGPEDEVGEPLLAGSNGNNGSNGVAPIPSQRLETTLPDIPPTIVQKPIRSQTRINTAVQPTVLRSVGNPLPSPNDRSRSRLRLFGRKKVTTITQPVPQPPMTFGRRIQVYLLARPWLPLLLGLLIVLVGGGAMLARNGGLDNVPFLSAFLRSETPTVSVPTATATVILIDAPQPTMAMMPTVPVIASPAATPPPPPPTVEVPTALAVGVFAQTTSDLNVRADASVRAARVTTLSAGATVKIIEGPKQADGITWWKVTNIPGQPADKVGWCSGQFLKPVAPPQ